MTPTPGEERVREIEQRHARGLDSPLLGDNQERDDIAYLLERLREMEGERDRFQQEVHRLLVHAHEEARQVLGTETIVGLRTQISDLRAKLAQAEQRVAWLRRDLSDAIKAREHFQLETDALRAELARFKAGAPVVEAVKERDAEIERLMIIIDGLREGEHEARREELERCARIAESYVVIGHSAQTPDAFVQEALKNHVGTRIADTIRRPARAPEGEKK